MTGSGARRKLIDAPVPIERGPDAQRDAPCRVVPGETLPTSAVSQNRRTSQSGGDVRVLWRPVSGDDAGEVLRLLARALFGSIEAADLSATGAPGIIEQSVDVSTRRSTRVRA